jgi:hypothetical protein
LIKLIKKKIKKNPRRWHEVLSEALWEHHISKHGATNARTPSAVGQAASAINC